MDNNNMYDQNQQPQQQAPYQQQSQPQPQFQQQPYQQAPYQAPNGELEEPMSYGEWMLTLLIMMIPCVNLVMMFVWAFGSSAKKSKSNYFKARLTWAAIGLVICVIYVILLMAFGASIASDFYGTSSYSYF